MPKHTVRRMHRRPQWKDPLCRTSASGRWQRTVPQVPALWAPGGRSIPAATAAAPAHSKDSGVKPDNKQSVPDNPYQGPHSSCGANFHRCAALHGTQQRRDNTGDTYRNTAWNICRRAQTGCKASQTAFPHREWRRPEPDNLFLLYYLS